MTTVGYSLMWLPVVVKSRLVNQPGFHHSGEPHERISDGCHRRGPVRALSRRASQGGAGSDPHLREADGILAELSAGHEPPIGLERLEPVGSRRRLQPGPLYGHSRRAAAAAD